MFVWSGLQHLVETTVTRGLNLIGQKVTDIIFTIGGVYLPLLPFSALTLVGTIRYVM